MAEVLAAPATSSFQVLLVAFEPLLLCDLPSYLAPRENIFISTGGNRSLHLRIQREIVDEGKELADTAAGAAILGNLERKIRQQQREAEELKRELADLIAENDKKHEAEIQEMREEFAGMQATIALLQNENRSLRETSDAERIEHETMMRRTVDKMAALEEELRALRADAAERGVLIRQLLQAVLMHCILHC